MVEKLELSVLPWIDSVCVREPQPVGSCSTTWLIWVLEPRSICAHWGKTVEPLVLSQYEPWLLSLRLLAGNPLFVLLAETALPSARLVPAALAVAAWNTGSREARSPATASRPVRRSLVGLSLVL